MAVARLWTGGAACDASAKPSLSPPRLVQQWLCVCEAAELNVLSPPACLLFFCLCRCLWDVVGCVPALLPLFDVVDMGLLSVAVGPCGRGFVNVVEPADVVVVVVVFVFVIVGGVGGERGCRAAVVPAQRSFVVAAEGKQRGGTGHPLSVYQNEAPRGLVRAALGGAADARRRYAEWSPRLVCMNGLVCTGDIAVLGRA